MRKQARAGSIPAFSLRGSVAESTVSSWRAWFCQGNTGAALVATSLWRSVIEIMKKSNTRHSKFLSLVLRHKPQEIGLSLAPGGWVGVDDLLRAMTQAGRPLTRSQLEDVVRTNDKKRFSFSEDGQRIRAAQGHSVEVDMQLRPATPPEQLYHGTASRFLGTILEEGLKPMARQHVHLSLDYQTAHKVGSRHGKPVILIVKAGEMKQDGHSFFRADNGVWLAEAVAPEYLELNT